MKKILALSLVVAALALAGCAGAPTDADNESTDVEAAASAPDTQTGTDAASASSITIRANGTTLQMTLADTDAADALVEILQNGPISVPLHSYGGFEKVGTLPQALPTKDEEITTSPGDVMLYEGNQITIFLDANTWSYTPLGHIEDASIQSLLDALGSGDVTVTLSL